MPHYGVTIPYVFHSTSVAGLILTQAAGTFFEAIRRKWDFENDCPLPDGLVRQQDLTGIQRLVWKKTEELYSPP